MRLRWVSLLFVLLFALGACSPVQAVPPSDVPPAESQTAPTERPTLDPSNESLPFPTATEITMPDFSSAPLEKFVNLTKKDLAAQLNIDIETISLTNSAQVTWPDASLGCPRPSVMYAQGLVPGYRIWLTANQIEYIYHTDLNGRFVLCPDLSEDSNSGIPPVPGPTIGVPID